MKPLSDDDLILYYYGEADDPQAIERRLADAPGDRARLEALRRLLDRVVAPAAPPRGEEYGETVWRRVADRLPDVRRRPGFAWPRALDRRWALAAAAALLVVVSFVSGRLWQRTEIAPQPFAVSETARQRILETAVASHLARTEMLLLELANVRRDEAIDLSIERRLADELSQENRLYREAARIAARTDIAAMLDEVQRLLLELAHGPDRMEADDLTMLHLRLEERDILFRLRVMQARLEREARRGTGAPRAPTATT